MSGGGSRPGARRGGFLPWLALPLLAVGLVWLGGRAGLHWVRAEVARRVVALAAARGVSLELAPAQVGIGWTQVVLRGVTLRHVRVEGQLDAVEAELPPWRELVAGDVRLRALRVRGGELRVRGSKAEGQADPREARGRALHGALPPVRVEDLRVQTPVGALDLVSVTLTRNGEWRAQGQARWASPLGPLALDLSWQGRSGEVTPGAEDGWRVTLPGLGPRRVRVARVALGLDPVEARVEGAEITGLGAVARVVLTREEAGWRARAEGVRVEEGALPAGLGVEAAELRLGPRGDLTGVRLEGVRARVDGGTLMRLVARLGDGEPLGAAGPPGASAGTRAGVPWRALATYVPITLEGARVDLPDLGLAVVGASVVREGATWSLSGRLEGEARAEGVLSGRVRLHEGGAAHARLAYAGCLVPRSAEARLAAAGVALASACQDEAELDLTLGDEAWEVQGRVALAGWTLEAAGIAAAPVQGVGVDAQVEARVERDLGRASLRLAPLTLGPLRVSGDLTIDRRGGAPRVTLDLDVPRQACDHLVRGLPPSLVPDLEGMWLGGELEAKVHYEVDLARVYAMYDARAAGREEPYQSTLEITGEEHCRVTSWPRAIDPRALLRDDFVHEWPLDEEGARVAVGPGAAGYVPLADIPASVRLGALATEDIRFYEHAGVNPGLVRTALEMDVHAGRFKYGGSTITQQLVKNLYLTRTKTIARKLEEALLALALERVVPKDRVLELYLNVIEFGRGVYGIGAAARHYFGVPVGELRPEEAAFLMTCKPSPADCQRLLDRGRGLGPRWTKKVDFVLDRLHRLMHVLSDEEVANARAREVRFRRGPLPDAAGLPPEGGGAPGDGG